MNFYRARQHREAYALGKGFRELRRSVTSIGSREQGSENYSLLLFTPTSISAAPPAFFRRITRAEERRRERASPQATSSGELCIVRRFVLVPRVPMSQSARQTCAWRDVEMPRSTVGPVGYRAVPFSALLCSTLDVVSKRRWFRSGKSRNSPTQAGNREHELL